MAAPTVNAGDFMRGGSSQLWEDNVFSRNSTSRMEIDDEEALKWAALEKLPTYDRLKTAILNNVGDTGKVIEEVDVTRLGSRERQILMEKIFRPGSQAEHFMHKLRDRIDKAGIEIPRIEVRFEGLNVDAEVRVGKRALPTLTNFVSNAAESCLGFFHLSPSRRRLLNILNDISGIIKPSRLTLLLGPPGSGKTTLLLALAGKLDPDLEVKGRVTYNGHEMSEFVPQRTSAYISQHDLHIGEMTVRETFDFSTRCQGVGSRYEMITELSRREKEAGIKPDPDVDAFLKASAVKCQEQSIVTDYVLKVLGLDICADTLVGDDMRRGISGGQKKRVTTGEMIVGPAKSLFMDEISTGLDSSTTYQIIASLRQHVHLMDATMLISLLQPAPETFELFDDLILLSEGKAVYQGPLNLVLDFFETQGFKCPPRKGVADFLQEVTSRKDQEQYWADKERPYQYVPVERFAEAFKQFHVGQALTRELSIPFDKSKSHPAALVTERYALSNWELFNSCLSKELLLMRRNSFVYIFKTTQILIMALITMTVFLRTEMHSNTVNDGGKYMGALFFGLITVMFNGFAELSMTIFKLPVFYKQRDQLLYPAWAYALPTVLTRIPLSFLESGIWVFLTYWVIGFAPEAGRFFRQFFLLFLVTLMSQGLFRFIASLGRTMVIANTFGSFALLIVFVLGGFIVARDNIHPWWIWGYWASPMMYGQNAIAVNEFTADKWQKNDTSASSPATLGRTILESRGIFADAQWYWIGVGAQIGFSVLFNAVFTLALTYLNPLGKTQAVLSEDALEEKAANRTGKASSISQSASQSASSNRRQRTGEISLQRIDANGAELVVKRGMVLPFQPLSMSFNHVSYYVDMPVEMKNQGVTETRLQLLNDVSGAFRPGVLTALIGVSGAGKTTLMDVLAGRKTGGYIEGDINISGYPKRQETFARISGYCEQTDVHSPNVTVYESLIYSAWLRLPKEIEKESKRSFVEEVMELVELRTIQDALVGLPGVNGLSTEQRKRLTIAVELVANPSIIFMDEPTSGLDARAAAIVMRVVRNTVDTGRTVVCTIHQPSIDIFESFDELLLLKRGGQVIYSGSLGKHSADLIHYFEAIEGIPKITEGYNPATWMLEVTAQAVESQLNTDFAQVYKESSLYQNNQALIQQLSKPNPEHSDIYFPTKFPVSFWEQCAACLWKQHWSYWRNPLYNVIRMFFTTVIALIFGSIFWDLGSKRENQQDLFNVMGSMYGAVLFIGVTNASSVQPVVGIERTVYYRERAAGMYSALPYALAQVMIEVPYVLVQSLSYGLIVYAMMQLEWDAAKFLWFQFFLYFTFLYFTLYGMMAVALSPNDQFAAIVSSAFYSIWNLFSGFLIPRPAIPVWWRWYYWTTPTAWSLYGLITSQFGDLEKSIDVGDGKTKPIKVFLKDYFGFEHDLLGVVAAVHVGLVFLFAFVFAFGIRTFNFQKR